MTICTCTRSAPAKTAIIRIADENMYLSSLRLTQFRSYDGLDLGLSSGLNVFSGPNGSGKSNLLEAVAVLATGQSHRGADTKHLAQWEKDGFALKGAFRGETDLEVEIKQRRGRARQVLIDACPQKRLRDWVGRIPLVSFSPDDLHLVKGEPAARRRVLNAVLCQIDPEYLDTLARYNKVLAERNAALRQVQEGEQPSSVLEPWDAALLKDGASLTARRRAFLNRFEPGVRKRHGALSSGRETVGVAYKPSFLPADGGADAVAAANRRRLADLREGELAMGSTLIGPHRDDLELTLNNAPARAYASQGQQRTLALSVKLAELDFLTETLERRPLCLLDDMLSELDPDRRENLVGSLTEGAQCLVTLTSLGDWPHVRERLSQPGSQLFEMSQGTFVPVPVAKP
jgi:DNA replication and repair protein RecF